MDRLGQLEVFVRVVQAGSFTAAARSLRVGQPTVSKAIAALEDRLQTRLVLRSPSGVVPTEEGSRLYPRAQGLLDALEETEGTVGDPTILRGKLRIAAPTAFGRRKLTAPLAAFLQRHPGLQVMLELHDRGVDLLAENIDVSVRLGPLADTSWVARRLGRTRRVLVATPGYIEGHGVPGTPEDLRNRDCVVHRAPDGVTSWTFESDTGPVPVPVTGRFETNDGEAALAAVLADLGPGLLPAWLCDRPLLDGRLVPLLEANRPTLLDIHALVPFGRLMPRRVRTLLDFLYQEFRIDPSITDYGPKDSELS